MIQLITSLFLLSSVVNFCEPYTVTYENSEKNCAGNQYTHIYDYLQENTYCFKLRWCDEDHCCVHECGAYSWKAKYVTILNTEFIPPNAFTDSENLAYISGKQQNITTLASKSFVNLHNIFEINLGYNHIRYIQHDVFVNVSAHTLMLSWNKIVYIENGAFDGLSQLKYLDLNYNELTYFYSFPKNSALVALNLSYNYLKRLVISSERYPHLKFLYASHNKLTNVAITAESMDVINLSYNGLETLDVFKIDNVIELYIGHNKFKDIDISICQNVKRISLNPNRWEHSSLQQILGTCNVLSIEQIPNDNNSSQASFPVCRDDTMCLDNQICRTNRCFDPCNFRVCSLGETCKTTKHVYSCTCPGNTKKNPVSYRSKCEDKECFVDEDCSNNVPCDKKTHMCDPGKSIGYHGGSSTMMTYPWYYDEIDPVLGEKVYVQNFQATEGKDYIEKKHNE